MKRETPELPEDISFDYPRYRKIAEAYCLPHITSGGISYVPTPKIDGGSSTNISIAGIDKLKSSIWSNRPAYIDSMILLHIEALVKFELVLGYTSDEDLTHLLSSGITAIPSTVGDPDDNLIGLLNYVAGRYPGVRIITFFSTKKSGELDCETLDLYHRLWAGADDSTLASMDELDFKMVSDDKKLTIFNIREELENNKKKLDGLREATDFILNF